MAPAKWFYPDEPTFWTPSIRAIDSRISAQSSSTALKFYRYSRLSWVIITIPLHILTSLIVTVAPTLPLPIWVPGRHRPTWTWRQRFIYPIFHRIVWSFTGVGGPLWEITDQDAREISTIVLAEEKKRPQDKRVHVWVEDIQPPRDEERWIVNEAVDPRGEVLPQATPCFWFDLEKNESGRRLARDGERVVLFFIGGAYTLGNPSAGHIAFEQARKSGLRVAGANYRKATSESKGFPAALQDAITVYKHLACDLGYRDIVISGDSAGGGLALTLQLYLANTLAKSANIPTSFVLPSGLILLSPWCDLSLTTLLPPIGSPQTDDMLNLTHLFFSSNIYLSNLAPRDTDSNNLGMDEEEYRRSPWALRSRHPYYSPAREDARPTLAAVHKVYQDCGEALRILVISGGAERFTLEIRNLVANLEAVSGSGLEGDQGAKLQGGFEVRHIEVEDEIHVFMLLPPSFSPNAEGMVDKIGQFLL
ncbi:alpha/beta-hydrolase, partial [Meredithblackwellia eburnea MCA 4105]